MTCWNLAWFAALLLSFLLIIGKSNASNPHCSQACDECPEDSEEICTMLPEIRKHSCMCKVHTHLCATGSSKLVFFTGPCKYPFSGISDGIFLLTGSKVVPLGSKLSRKEHFSGSRSMDGDDAEASPRSYRGFRPVPRKVSKDMCNLFFDQDFKFMKTYRAKHFQCVTADKTKVDIIPLDSSDEKL